RRRRHRERGPGRRRRKRRRRERFARAQPAGRGPTLVMDEVGEERGRELDLEVPEGDAREEVERAVVGVVVGGVRDEDLGGAEVAHERAQVAQDLLALVRRAGAEGARVRDGGDARQLAPERRLLAPVLGPDLERPEVRVAEKGELAGAEAEDAGGGHRLPPRIDPVYDAAWPRIRSASASRPGSRASSGRSSSRCGRRPTPGATTRSGTSITSTRSSSIPRGRASRAGRRSPRSRRPPG